LKEEKIDNHRDQVKKKIRKETELQLHTVTKPTRNKKKTQQPSD
jgi:hypothetical protein